MEIALTADVAVAQGLVVGRLVEESAIEAALEDRTDRGDGASLDEDAASAGGIDARIELLASDRIPRQVRKPCSGCGRASMTTWKNAAVDGPIFSPAAISPPGVHLP